ncbi:hypothetical protein [Aliidongia dinghuensis]|uniref:hypothetical protein n=1 Tax=Aliidongia dinghuensis TaxID=1867774 RepID=UPI00166F38B7|nr:hypothetical protein [Aliidongia dinghuensis]
MVEAPRGFIELGRGAGAHIAMTLTRAALSRKSANKARVQSVTIPEKPYAPEKFKPSTVDRTIENAGLLTEQIRNEAGRAIISRLEAGSASWGDIQAYAARVRAIGTGNCLEYAIVAFEKLCADGWRQLELVQLFPPSTHCFVILGSARAPGAYGAGFPFAADVVVCDPWAHIACDAAVYEREWAARMQKWADERKEIFGGGQSISPLNYTLQHRQLVMCSVR